MKSIKRQSNKTRCIVRRAQVKHKERLMREFKQKPKAFYSYVREKQKVKLGVSQLETDDGSLTNTDREAADELSKFFRSVFTHEPDGAIPTLPKRHDDTMHDTDFTVENVQKKLDNLKVDKCPGPDKLHPMLDGT